MAFIYRAYPDEAKLLRELFGDTVTEVMFWDHDFPDQEEEHWGAATGTLADGSEVQLTPQTCDRWEEIEDLCEARAETVKFGLTVPPPAKSLPNFDHARAPTKLTHNHRLDRPDWVPVPDTCPACSVIKRGQESA